MCGIVGIVHLDATEVSPRLLRAMVSQVRYRGPDSMGVAIDGPVGLGHARLSIVDLEHGRQPMSSRDGLLTVSFNGEIFNHIELRQSLISKGRRFDTNSDTEVILQAYQEYGEDCVHHFNGQWAFAIWDRARRRLFLSRDRLGIRPLFYTSPGGSFFLARNSSRFWRTRTWGGSWIPAAWTNCSRSGRRFPPQRCSRRFTKFRPATT